MVLDTILDATADDVELFDIAPLPISFDNNSRIPDLA
jgi:hypothetical protein